jgi:phage terminase large subunit GpA-like protein
MVALLTDAEILYNDFYRRGLKPDPDEGIAEWADKNVVLSSKGSAAPGNYQTSRVPFTREIMDCLSPSHPCDHVVFMKPAQITGTQLILNWNGYTIDVCPGPFLIVEPTVDMAKKLSKQRLQEMILDSPVLNSLIKPSREKDGGNTLLCKEYPGGVTILTGANSASSLRMMPIRNLALDEVDSYPLDLDGEGDPIALAVKRTTTFGRRRKIFILSSPTEKDNSRIEREYLMSDQRKYHLPCPHCGHMQHLQWSGIKFRHDEKYKLLSEVTYICENCACIIEERYKTDMLTNGKWIAGNTEGRCPGFHINGLYSPLGWLSWKEIVLEFLKFKKMNDEPLQKAWTNTVLAETWEAKGATLEHTYLFNRRKPATDSLNPDIVLLTCAVDVQDDRLECKVIGWQQGEECRVVEIKILIGSPAEMLVWENLREFIQKTYLHEHGLMRIVATTIDTGGHYTAKTYEFVKSCDDTKVFAIKGSSTPGSPISGKPSMQKNGVNLYMIGTDTIKDLLFNRLLKITEPGPGYIHFPDILDEDYFKQLTAEKKVTKYVRGFKKYEWVKIRKRNEQLDLMVYNIAALYIIAYVVFPNLTISQILDSLRQKSPKHGQKVIKKQRPRVLNKGERIE